MSKTKTKNSGVKIYTSYHAKAAKFKAVGVLHISISLYNRYTAKGYVAMPELAPSASFFKAPHKEYVPKFNALLSALDPKEVYEKIVAYAREHGTQEVALCCFENPKDFCHRHMVAKWLEPVAGTITEWGLDDKANAECRTIQNAYVA